MTEQQRGLAQGSPRAVLNPAHHADAPAEGAVMSINAIRFRAEGALLVLQVSETSQDSYYPHESRCKWRDATVEDMLEVAPFANRRRSDIEQLATQIDWVKQQIRDVEQQANEVLP